MGKKQKCRVSAWLFDGCEEAFASMLRHPGAALKSLDAQLQDLVKDTAVHKQPLAVQEAQAILQSMAACASKATSWTDADEADALCRTLFELDQLAKGSQLTSDIAMLLASHSLLRCRVAFALNPNSCVKPRFDVSKAPLALGLGAVLADFKDEGLSFIEQHCGEEQANRVRAEFLHTSSNSSPAELAVARAMHYARARRRAQA